MLTHMFSPACPQVVDIYVLVYYFYARTLAQVRDARALPLDKPRG